MRRLRRSSSPRRQSDPSLHARPALAALPCQQVFRPRQHRSRSLLRQLRQAHPLRQHLRSSPRAWLQHQTPRQRSPHPPSSLCHLPHQAYRLRSQPLLRSSSALYRKILLRPLPQHHRSHRIRDLRSSPLLLRLRTHPTSRGLRQPAHCPHPRRLYSLQHQFRLRLLRLQPLKLLLIPKHLAAPQLHNSRPQPALASCPSSQIFSRQFSRLAHRPRLLQCPLPMLLRL